MDEFWWHTSIWGFGEDEFRQVPDFPSPKSWTGIHIFWYSGCAYILVHPMVYNYESKKYMDQPRAFRVGCDHKNAKSELIANCLHQVTCLDCGYVNEIDSSG